MHSRAVALIAGFLVIAFLLGCGGDDDTDTTSSATNSASAGATDTEDNRSAQSEGDGNAKGDGSAGDTETGGGGSANSGSGGGSAGSETEDGSAGGETGNSDSAGADSSSKAAFVKQANEICAVNDEQFTSRARAFVRKEEKTSNLDSEQLELLAVSKVMGGALDTEVAQIEALGAPAGDAAQVNAILVAIGEVADVAREDPEGFLQAPDALEKAEKLASSYGLTRCPI